MSTWLNRKHFGVSIDIVIIMLCFTLHVRRDTVVISLFSPLPFSESNFCWLLSEVISLVEQSPVLMSTRSQLCKEEGLAFP